MTAPSSGFIGVAKSGARQTSAAKVQLLIFRPPDHWRIGNAVAHHIRVTGSKVRSLAVLSRVLASLLRIDSDDDDRLSSTRISSRLCAKCAGA
ncbi:hypothetical protein PspLS_10360 [Pyricularia sp. CBS 133598]|nr:hypothetical protein PspLS_10360 [Pyricularia sp. CBS 133598]